MPVYEYECNDCEKVFEVQQKISDEPIKICPECQGEVRKLVSMSSFQLKGGGWYADGYGSASAAKDTTPAEKPAAPACASGNACSGCPAAAPG
ncbi:MAG: zinc ribbon domain-containing protein [Desulfopila sp.]|nr:zinc ribbon domain-containing protein [Desulfopila sp.]